MYIQSITLFVKQKFIRISRSPSCVLLQNLEPSSLKQPKQVNKVIGSRADLFYLPIPAPRSKEKRKRPLIAAPPRMFYAAVTPIASAIFTTLLAILAEAASIKRPSNAAAPLP